MGDWAACVLCSLRVLLGSATAPRAFFGGLAEKHEGVSREARDTAGEAPALP